MRVGYVTLNPWQVRENFIALEHDSEQLLKFLNQVGSWDLMPSISVSDYWEWQEILRVIHSDPTGWRRAVSNLNHEKVKRLSSIPNHHLTIEALGEFKKATFSCANDSVLDAIIASVHVDEGKLLRQRPTTLRDAKKKLIKKAGTAKVK